jgi:hypothetical protein
VSAATCVRFSHPCLDNATSAPRLPSGTNRMSNLPVGAHELAAGPARPEMIRFAIAKEIADPYRDARRWGTAVDGRRFLAVRRRRETTTPFRWLASGAFRHHAAGCRAAPLYPLPGDRRGDPGNAAASGGGGALFRLGGEFGNGYGDRADQTLRRVGDVDAARRAGQAGPDQPRAEAGRHRPVDRRPAGLPPFKVKPAFPRDGIHGPPDADLSVSGGQSPVLHGVRRKLVHDQGQ